MRKNIADPSGFRITARNCSVVDPNTLNLDPDPGFWASLDPGPDPDAE